jgi:hypothetical protein
VSRPPPPGSILRTVSRLVTRATAEDPELLDRVRQELFRELNEFADRCGYTRHTTREVLNLDRLTLTGLMSPRTDGQWPAIHEAIAEDERDLRRLKNPGDPF